MGHDLYCLYCTLKMCDDADIYALYRWLPCSIRSRIDDNDPSLYRLRLANQVEEHGTASVSALMACYAVDLPGNNKLVDFVRCAKRRYYDENMSVERVLTELLARTDAMSAHVLAWGIESTMTVVGSRLKLLNLSNLSNLSNGHDEKMTEILQYDTRVRLTSTPTYADDDFGRLMDALTWLRKLRLRSEDGLELEMTTTAKKLTIRCSCCRTLRVSVDLDGVATCHDGSDHARRALRLLRECQSVGGAAARGESGSGSSSGIFDVLRRVTAVTKRCLFCNKALSSPESICNGAGVTCLAKQQQQQQQQQQQHRPRHLVTLIRLHDEIERLQDAVIDAADTRSCLDEDRAIYDLARVVTTSWLPVVFDERHTLDRVSDCLLLAERFYGVDDESEPLVEWMRDMLRRNSFKSCVDRLVGGVTPKAPDRGPAPGPPHEA